MFHMACHNMNMWVCLTAKTSSQKQDVLHYVDALVRTSLPGFSLWVSVSSNL